MRLPILVFSALLLFGTRASAQSDDEATRATVRTLGYEGIAHYEAGEYEAALDKLDRSYALIKVPTLGLWSARALAKLGRWVEASERYFDVMRLPLPELEPEVHAQAQTEAEAERQALEPRIPKLTVVVPDAEHGVTVTLDERPIALELLEAPIPVDPGDHVVVAMRGEQRVEQQVTVAEGARLQVVLRLPEWQPPAPEPAAPPPAPVAPPLPEPPPLVLPSDSGMHPQAIAGWATLAVGGAVFAAGVIVAGVALAKRNALDCPGGKCPPELADDAAAVNDLRVPSTITITAGLVGLAAGTVILLTVPSDEAVSLSIDPLGGGLRGTF